MFFSMNTSRRHRLYPLLLAAVVGVTVGTAQGQEQPVIAALSAVLMNPATGEVIFAKASHLTLPPASTTKVLTALVVLERMDPNTRIPVSAKAASAAPSRVGLRAGESVMAQDLLYGLLLKSGNDAAETLAEGAGGSISGFADRMNAKARQIGANDSHFVNPHGLPAEDHYSTAYDLAVIFRQAMNHPLFADIVRTRSAGLRIESARGAEDTSRMVAVQTHNRLLASYEGTRGGKTGYTVKARHCFVGEVDRGGVRLIVSILNSPSRGTLWQDARTLLDYGFARYGITPAPTLRSEDPPPMTASRSPVRSVQKPRTSNQDDDDEEVVKTPRAAKTPVAQVAKAVQPPTHATPATTTRRNKKAVVVAQPQNTKEITTARGHGVSATTKPQPAPAGNQKRKPAKP